MTKLISENNFSGESLLIEKTKMFIKNNEEDLKYIAILTIFLLVISIPKLIAQYNIGIGNWDTYLYLENGRNFAKMGWGDVPSIAPVIPIILSKMFLLAGHTYHEAIFNIDVVFYILGIITFYLLLRRKFGYNTSFTGSVIYATFTLLYSWVAIGGNDIIGVTGTLLAIYLIVSAHEYNNKLYYIALPISAYAFLSRYTAGVMIFSILFYWTINRISLREIKHIIIGGILGVISISWFLNEFYIHLGTPFPFLGQFSGTVSNTVVMDSGFLPDSWYYIKHIPNYLISYVPNVNTFNAIVNPMGNIPEIISYVYIALFLMGFVLLCVKIISAVKNKDNKLRKGDFILLSGSVILLAVFLLTLSSISYVTSTILFLIALYLIFSVLKPYNIERLDYDFLMISLFVIYLIFQSILFTKNDRYFITVLPFIAYFISLSIDSIYNLVDKKIKMKKIKASAIITCIIAMILLANTLVFVIEIPTDNDYSDIEEACEWFGDTHNITNKSLIYSDNWPAVTWYFNIFCQRGVPDMSNPYFQTEFAYEILHSNDSHRAAEYYFVTNNKNVEYPGLKLIKQFNSVRIYENKYLEGNGANYLNTTEYNNRLLEEISEFNKTISDNNV